MAENYILLQRIELTTNVSDVIFNNIPQTGYTDLKILVAARNASNNYGGYQVRLNGATTNNSLRTVKASGTTVSSASRSDIIDVCSLPIAGDTANTFSCDEIYIPNYTSSNYKSFSTESTREWNTSTDNSLRMSAALWSSTSAVTSVTLSLDIDSFASGSTFSLYGLAAVGTTPSIAPKASGGNITTDGTYWYHIFNATDTFVPATNLTCDYLVVAGGGGAGTGGGGGGGAGGYRTSIGGSTLSVTAQTYTIAVGAGGAYAAGTSSSGSSGTNSSFSTITSTGGGGGGGRGGTSPGLNGGSGGGEGCSVTGKGLASPTGQGNNGGAFGGGSDSGGGGGGAGAVGQDSSTKGGNGGNGLANSITGSSVTYAGGGGGGCSNGGGAGGTGGTGGGGTGGTASVGTGTNATPNTGGGGGGGGLSGSAGGNGGSGIVVIRYAV